MAIPSSQSLALHARRAVRRIVRGRIIQDLELWSPEGEQTISGTRLCVTISDIHFTDATVGIQNLTESDWKDFFGEIVRECKLHHVSSCYIIFDGDLVDFIRTDRWARAGVYPWQVDDDRYVGIVNDIMDAIAEKHEAFFSLLRDIPSQLESVDVELIVLLGNHDKPILASEYALSRLYELVFGKPVKELSSDYREWIGRMYFGDGTHFADAQTVPWLPFYFADEGFRYFVTHGHWRDPYNSRRVKASKGKPGWKVTNGWRIDIWKKLGFRPFLLPCFGDTVAAGVLSTFIYKARSRLRDAQCLSPRLERILGELDLYRPTYAAITRILKEARRVRRHKPDDQGATARIIEQTVTGCVREWLSWPFTRESATPSLRRWLQIFRVLIHVGIHLRIQLTFVRMLMRVLAWKNRILGLFNQGMTITDLRTLPAFLPEYRRYGFKIHGEGHTHEPTQEEPNLRDGNTYTYVNFGTWRDRIVRRKRSGYRRRGTLRAFYLLDMAGKSADSPRHLQYRTSDRIEWSDTLDRLG